MDFITGVVVDVLPDRKKDSLIRYLSDIKNKTYDPKTHRSELDNVKFISGFKFDLNGEMIEIEKELVAQIVPYIEF